MRPSQFAMLNTPTTVSSQNAKIVLSVRAISGFLFVSTALLVLFAAIGQMYRWEHDSDHFLISTFDLDAEKNVPTLFSGMLLCLAAICAALLANVEQRAKSRLRWAVLAVGMMVMALDELLMLHERPMDAVRESMGGGYLGIFTFAWVIPALVILPIIAWFFIDLLRNLPRESASGFLLSGVLYVGGAVGLEMVGGWYFGSWGSDLNQSLIAIVEESLEMLGICLFIYFALRHLSTHAEPMELHVQ